MWARQALDVTVTTRQSRPPLRVIQLLSILTGDEPSAEYRTAVV